MESDPSVPLLAGIGKNPPTDEGSASGADVSETSQTSPRRSPPPPPRPPPLGLDIAKNRVISSSAPSLPSPPSPPAPGIVKSHSASFSSPSSARVDFDPEAPPCRTPQQSSSAASATPPSLANDRQDREGLGSGASSSPSSGARWDLFGRLRRRAPPHLPVSAPRGSSRFGDLVKELRHSGPRLDSVGVERVIGIFGFSLFGSLSLFPYTIDRIKDFTTANKSIVVFIFGFVWVLASVGVVSGLQGKSDFEQALCRFTGRLGVVGLAMLVVFHVWWALPSDNTYCTFGFGALAVFALGLHLLSWGWSVLVGEDRIEDTASPEARD